MADKTDLTPGKGRRAESSSYNASSMDRYELRLFEPPYSSEHKTCTISGKE